MDPIYRFYSGPTQGGGGASARSIPIYEGYGFLSNLSSRVLIPVLRSAGKDLLSRGLEYLTAGEKEAIPGGRKRKHAGAGFDMAGVSPTRRSRKTISKRKKPVRKQRKRKTPKAQRGKGLGIRKRAKRGTKKRRTRKAGASASLFNLLKSRK